MSDEPGWALSFLTEPDAPLCGVLDHEEIGPSRVKLTLDYWPFPFLQKGPFDAVLHTADGATTGQVSVTSASWLKDRTVQFDAEFVADPRVVN